MAAVITWVLWRVCAMGPWVWLLSAILQKAFGADILPCPGWVAISPLVTFVTALLEPQILPPTWPAWTTVPLNILRVVVYVLIVPMIWIYIVSRRVPQALIKCATVFHALTHPFMSAVLLVTIAAVWLGLVFVDNELTLLVLIYTQIALVIVFLAGALRWAIDPLLPFVRLVSSLEWWIKFIDELTPQKPSMTHEEEAQWKKTRLTRLGLASRGMSLLTPRLQGLARRSIVPLFTWIVLACYLLVATAFGGVVFASQKLSDPAFSGLDTNLLKCWAYALTALTTSPIGSVLPKSDLSVFIYTTELLCTFLILTVFFSLFSVAMGLHGRQRSGEIDEASKKLSNWLIQEQRVLNPVNNEDTPGDSSAER
jgi:hypothetical protein